MKRLSLFPDTTEVNHGTLSIAGQDLTGLADQYGTPLYLYDRNTIDNALAVYQEILAASYPAASFITYAGKAYLCLTLAQWALANGLWLDCSSEGEIAIAKAGGLPRENILVHGVNKSAGDLQSAVQNGGTIVVDNPSELRRLVPLFNHTQTYFPEIWLRLQPGMAVATHSYTQTGQHTSKFGMEGEELMETARFCEENGLPLTGLHFHLGSQFRDPAPLRPAIELALGFAKQIRFPGAWHFSPGGGWGVSYHEDELPQPAIHEYVQAIASCVQDGCKKLDLPLPHLHLEPGRSLVARAGVALYRVTAIKRQGGRTWQLVDGGIADNPRHALYEARYSCLPVENANRENSERVYIAGPYCESGDILIEDLPMPKMEEGELIAVPVSGAYQLSMASNYNGARRPAALWMANGQARLMQRREAPEDMLRRDFDIPT